MCVCVCASADVYWFALTGVARCVYAADDRTVCGRLTEGRDAGLLDLSDKCKVSCSRKDAGQFL